MKQGYLHPNKRHVIKIVHAEQLTVRNKQLHTFIVCFKAMIELYTCVKKNKCCYLVKSRFISKCFNVVVWLFLFMYETNVNLNYTFLHTVAVIKPHIKKLGFNAYIYFLKKIIPFPQLCFFPKPLPYLTSNWQIMEEPLEQTNYADRNCAQH